MNQKNFLHRTLALGLAMVCIAGVLLTRLASLQLVPAENTGLASEAVETRTYNESTARGEILDRNGNRLISNALGFSVEFDYYEWDKSRQNEVISSVLTLLREQGVEYRDSLPLSNGSGGVISYTYEGEDSSGRHDVDRYLKANPKWPGDPSAEALLELMCEKYKVDDSLSLMEKRSVVGVRYEMEQSQFSAFNNPFVLLSDVDMEMVGKLSERCSLFPGVTIGVKSTREYSTDFAAHILGRTGKIFAENYDEYKDLGYPKNAVVGIDGAEKAFEPYLRGIDGTKVVEVDRWGSILSEFYSEDPKPGNNVFLTLDLGMQEVAENALAKTLEDIKAKGEKSKDKEGADVEGGSVVVMDVRTGEILAMASYPTYSLKTFNADYSSLLLDKLTPMLNRSIAGAYPPGSTFKMATALAALEEGTITPDTKIRDMGVFHFYDYSPACWLWNEQHRTHGLINVSEAIKYSCNYFFFDVASRLNIENLNKYASALGLGQKTGIELAGERAGNLAGPESRAAKGGGPWNAGETLQAAIGQSEQQFTPLQLVSYVSTIVNGGTRYQPHLLYKVENYSYADTVEQTAPSVLKKLDISASALKAIREGMLGVTTEDGTASSVFRGYPVKVGGKTGSAQTRAGRSSHGIFVSFAPYDDPEIAVCVVGEYAGTGGSVAPVCLAVYDYYFHLNQQQEAQPLTGGNQ